MRRLPLRARDGAVRAYALVDGADYEVVSRWRWSLHSGGYAARSPRGGMVLLHRFLMGLERGDRREVDHKNGDRLDNRRSNLRVVAKRTNRENMRARGGVSRFRGVSRRKDRRARPWVAAVMFNRWSIHCGYWPSELEAAIAAERKRAEVMPGALPDPELRRALAEAA